MICRPSDRVSTSRYDSNDIGRSGSLWWNSLVTAERKNTAGMGYPRAVVAFAEPLPHSFSSPSSAVFTCSNSSGLRGMPAYRTR